MACLGSEISIKGHIYKPFYLTLGVLLFLGLLTFLSITYIYCYIKLSLVEYINTIKRDRKRWLNKK